MTNLVFFHGCFFFILLEGINTSFKWLVLLWQDSNLLGNLVSLCTSFFPENDSKGIKYYIRPPCLLKITTCNSLYSRCKISMDYPILFIIRDFRASLLICYKSTATLLCWIVPGVSRSFMVTSQPPNKILLRGRKIPWPSHQAHVNPSWISGWKIDREE